MKRYIFLGVTIGLLFWNCNKESPEVNSLDKSNTQALEYSKSFTVTKNDSALQISYPTLQKKVILPNKKYQNLFVSNTSSIAYLEGLDAIDRIKGVASPEYIYNASIHDKINNQSITVMGNETDWEFEKIITQNIDLVITVYNPNFEKWYTQLSNHSIPILFVEEYTENHPLGRTEYIKLLGSILDLQEEATIIFTNIKKRYLKLQSQSIQKTDQPSLMAKIMYGDIWYMPGGKSYSAILYRDAGANYLWKNTNENGSLQLSFEEVFQKAYNTTIWMDVSDVRNTRELLLQNIQYQNFKPFKEKQLYSLSGKVKGKANDFYESGVVYADKVLQELQYIIKNYKNINNDSLYYYRRIEF